MVKFDLVKSNFDNVDHFFHQKWIGIVVPIIEMSI